MELACTTLTQIAVMFVIIAAGILCSRFGVIDHEKSRTLSGVILKVVTPALIISSFQTELTAEAVRGLYGSLLLGAVSFAISLLVPTWMIKKSRDYDYVVARFSCMYPNCGFIGIPLAYGVFGREGVFYINAFAVIFNLLVYSHGVCIMSSSEYHFSWKRLVSPGIIGVITGLFLFIMRWKLPYVVLRPMEMLADMNTPLAMLVAGVSMAETDLAGILKAPGVFRLSLYRLILIPALFILASRFIPLPEMVRMTGVLAASCPAAAIGILFSLEYGRDEVYASQLFAMTTILSIVTVPLMVWLASWL